MGLSDGLLLGIDAGQTTTKAALFELDGHQVACGEAVIDTTAPAPRWQERSMAEVWDGCVSAVRRCLDAAPQEPEVVLGVGVCGHGDGLYLVDEKLDPIEPAVLATDSRAHGYAARTCTGPVGERALELTGQVPFAASPASLLAWLRDHRPETYARVRWALHCKDWIRLRLTGEVATDPTEASASFADVSTQDWSAEALALYGLEELATALPPIRGCAELAGRLTAEAASATGLPAGIPVVTGAHDVDAAALGVGATSPGALSVVMGTFSINQVVAEEPRRDVRWQARAFLERGRWLHMSTSPSSANNLEWVVRQFGPHGPSGRPDHEAALAEGCAAARRGEADDAPIFLPFLYGSPHGDDLGAGWVGLRGWHDRGDVLRAVLEGVVFNHRTHVEVLSGSFDVRGRPARLCGGGARSSHWSQLLADGLGLGVEVTDADEAGARGAAMLAGLGISAYADVPAAVERAVRVVRSHEPDARAQERMAAGFDRYRAVVEALLS
ncbi:MAG: carbohydrate kinase [Euzebyales bacterium]|nr:carbohydrate kinase [Euzebyales bacterium]